MTEFKKFRQAAGLSCAEIGKIYGIPYRTLQNWEHGERAPQSYVLDMMARIWEREKHRPENIPLREIKKSLTAEGKAALKDGDLTLEEAAAAYKMQAVKKECVIGDLPDTFAAGYSRIPDGLKDKLSPQELAELVTDFYRCYGEGKKAAE